MEKDEKGHHPITISLALYVDELEKASKRIGETIDGVAIWFARFAQRNLRNLSTGEWTDLLYEVASLSEFQYRLTHERALWSHAITTQDWAGNDRTKDERQLEEWIALLFEQEANEGIQPSPLPPHTLPPRDAVARLQGNHCCPHYASQAAYLFGGTPARGSGLYRDSGHGYHRPPWHPQKPF